MSEMRKTHVIAVVCSDLHLSHNPPIFRSNEPDWYAAMDDSLLELRELCNQYEVPALIAGDIFDRWNSPAELINFAYRSLPSECYVVAGQHDLRNHDKESLHTTALGNLILSDRVQLLDHRPIEKRSSRGILWELRGFSWKELPKKAKHEFNGITLVHRYVWNSKNKHPKAQAKDNVKSIAKIYDSRLVVCGDNHKGFYNKRLNVMNCGGFYRRNSDQRKYEPRIGLVRSDFSVEIHKLCCMRDKDIKQNEELDDNTISTIEDSIENLISQLKSTRDNDFDFRTLLLQRLRNHSEGARNHALQSYLMEMIDGI